ncbi:hypothetical protein [Hymenobacter cavernae]|uniref:DUF4369 domain-containing protein n=1 Tax=Hymenobacter cavernae TaxID=2044852 RepID=A0ABQ1UUV7_9BACT|nr:hypothetical protein [Hymenobacter cavernae]GGF25845.1 hypothetical protein GCM10011383_41760 [Hymenobacter cavernae]
MQTTLRVTVILLSVLLTGRAQAQMGWADASSVHFTEGSVMLASGAVVQGEISLDRAKNKIALRMTNDTIYTLPAEIVRGFAVRGEQNRQKGEEYVALTRIFRSYSFPWSMKKAPEFKVWAFFEQLSEGPVMLLRREEPVQYNYAVVNANRTMMRSSTDITTTFYLSKNQGTPVALHKTKRDLLAFFPKQAREIKAYAKENELSFKNARELAFLVNYANSLQSPPPPEAVPPGY